jgi:hypothetical protein
LTARCFSELNPQAFAENWHLGVIAAKLTAVSRYRGSIAGRKPTGSTPSC